MILMSKCVCKKVIAVISKASSEIAKFEEGKGIVNADMIKTHKAMVYEKVFEILQKEGVKIEQV